MGHPHPGLSLVSHRYSSRLLRIAGQARRLSLRGHSSKAWAGLVDWHPTLKSPLLAHRAREKWGTRTRDSRLFRTDTAAARFASRDRRGACRYVGIRLNPGLGWRIGTQL